MFMHNWTQRRVKFLQAAKVSEPPEARLGVSATALQSRGLLGQLGWTDTVLVSEAGLQQSEDG